MTVRLLTASAVFVLALAGVALLVLAGQGVRYLLGKRDQSRRLTWGAIAVLLVYAALVAISRIEAASR